MKGLITVLAILVVLGLAFALYRSPSAPPEMTGAEIAQMEADARQAIADRWASYRAAILSGDAEGFLSFFTEDTRLLEPGVDFDRPQFESFIRDFWGSGGAVTSFDHESFEIFVHGDVAYELGQYREAFQMPEQEPAEAHGNFFARWEKGTDGVWRFDRFLSGPADAPAEG